MFLKNKNIIFKIRRSKVTDYAALRGDAFTRKYIISPLILTLGQGHTRDVALYPPHHMTYLPANFEVAMSNGLGESAFTRNICFDRRSHEALSTTSRGICIAMPLCASVYMCLVVTCWKRADLLALVCGV